MGLGVDVGVSEGVSVHVDIGAKAGVGFEDGFGASDKSATYVSQSMTWVTWVCCMGDGGGFGLSTLSKSFGRGGVADLVRIGKSSGIGGVGI